MQPMAFLDRFLILLCEDLQVKKPRVKPVGDADPRFPTATTLALLSSDGSSILVRRRPERDPDLLFAIAHELRHAWQLTYHRDSYFSDYTNREACEDLEVYNLPPAELDANAYAAIVMISAFGIRPLWQGYTPRVIDAIEARQNEISKEESPHD